ncbi:MAG TPA: hypothetical protein VGD19_02480 [Allosphingosinicella sp.]|jgi:hypothetical protein
MNDYWMTFRISGADEADRRSRLLGELRSASSEGSWWNETGSFVTFQSKLDIEALRDLTAGILDTDQDFALIGMFYLMKWELVGSARDTSLFQTLRYAGVF